MSVTQIKVGGFGGQGVVLAGMVIGRASAIYDNKCATMTRSYGPEARGGACSSQIVISDAPVDYPYVTRADVLIVLSQEAYTRYVKDLAPDGILLYENSLVAPNGHCPTPRQHGIPCLKIADELGSRVMLNVVMLGFLAKMSDAVSAEALKEAIRNSVPSRTIDINLVAFESGYTYEGKST